jgi:hypothetical protein
VTAIAACKMAINRAISHTRCEDNAGVAISFEGSIEVKESRLHAKRFRDLAIRWLNHQAMAAKVKNYLFNKARIGTIDLHYRDYEEPPGNGGFLLNGFISTWAISNTRRQNVCTCTISSLTKWPVTNCCGRRWPHLKRASA